MNPKTIQKVEYQCQHCNGNFDRLNVIINSKRINVKGDIVYQYMCNDCNTDRLRKYRKTKMGAEKTRKAVYASIKRNQHKQNARVELNRQLRLGNMARPKICISCGKKKKLEAHHDDYLKPLDVKWMCRPCHCIYHRNSV